MNPYSVLLAVDNYIENGVDGFVKPLVIGSALVVAGVAAWQIVREIRG